TGPATSTSSPGVVTAACPLSHGALSRLRSCRADTLHPQASSIVLCVTSCDANSGGFYAGSLEATCTRYSKPRGEEKANRHATQFKIRAKLLQSKGLKNSNSHSKTLSGNA